MPEWVQRELSSTGGWHPSVLEAWYSSSNACGASSDLMDSFRYFSETMLCFFSLWCSSFKMAFFFSPQCFLSKAFREQALEEYWHVLIAV